MNKSPTFVVPTVENRDEWGSLGRGNTYVRGMGGPPGYLFKIFAARLKPCPSPGVGCQTAVQLREASQTAGLRSACILRLLLRAGLEKPAATEANRTRASLGGQAALREFLV